jgi:hypothetical protein
MDLTGAEWRTSSFSSANGGQCVEVASNMPGFVVVRDSKDPHGPALVYSPAQWQEFAAGVRAGKFDPA